MPYDEDGNWIDPEDSVDTEEGAPVATASPDMAEYLRRAQLQSQMSSAAPAEYKAPPIGPEETKFRSLEAQAPIKQNFPVSRGRRILGMLAGAASRNPSVRENITDWKFNKAQQDFQQKLSVQQNLAAEEEAATKRANDAALTGNRTAAEAARREAEAARGARYQWMISPEGQKFELDKARLTHPGTAAKPEYHEAELNDGSKVQLVRTPEGRLKNVDTGEMVLPSAIKQLSDPGKSLKASAPELKGVLAEDVQAHRILQEEIEKPGTHSQFEVDAAKEYIKSRTSGRDPQDAFNVVVRRMEEEGQGKGPGGKLTSGQMIKLRNMMPEQRPPQELGITPGGTAIRVAPGTVVPPGTLTPQQAGTEAMGTATTRTMKETAPRVISLADTVLKQVEEQKNSLGPSSSRWNEFWAGKVGAPNPEFTKLRTNAALLQTALMRMHVGASGRVALMQHFQDLFDVSKQSPENMEAAVGEIKNYAQDILGNAPNTPNAGGLPKIGDKFEGSKVKSIKQIK